MERHFSDNTFVRHFCYIKKLSALVSKEHSKHKGKLHFCGNCLNFFSSAKVLKNHMPKCGRKFVGNDPVPEMPDKDYRIQFKNY